ncbi:START domain-containing protein [Dyadobacter sp. LJ53]|uniref:START domain-containing protein n=1 Tax=Dyadobacter chenwenxiniae TaxID=2906456 RepID=UPI001F1A09BF|nr:START domain-containing protein [Dyadobacter chenwenxiniae]MCF0051739.1 START domain-containing protein [Dyadobacter chenwenxiniae]
MNKAITIFFLLYYPVLGQPDWKLAAEKEGIKVYAKTIPDSKIKALKAECVVEATVQEVVALLLDVKAAENWVCHTKQCSLIKKVSPTELYYYTEVSLPWPLENRDFVTHMEVFQDPATKIVTVNAPAVPGFVSPKNGKVRITHSSNVWRIIPLDKRHVKLDYTLQVDPGGLLPAWVVNHFACQGPIISFTAMRKELQTGKYKQTNGH